MGKNVKIHFSKNNRKTMKKGKMKIEIGKFNWNCM